MQYVKIPFQEITHMVKCSSEVLLKGNANTCKYKQGLIDHKQDNALTYDPILRNHARGSTFFRDIPKGERKYLQV